MGQSEFIGHFRSEAQLTDFAGRVAQRWQTGRLSPTIGLRGDLGSGKTTWVRAALRGLGFAGRVPSPTYTLLEHYELGALHVVHLDLYRLAGEEELENLGIRDWLGEPRTWLFVEWPERAPRLALGCDLLLDFAFEPAGGRQVTFTARTALGQGLLAGACELNSNYES